ncbi:hypothetical protein ABZ865_02165 [Streptomyces sp. NPDC047085]|uniref:hypothetical protein n=1 Tax=Streptomyces sp. NPDC047085 TaxID=3155140 RepID=UPI003400AE33
MARSRHRSGRPYQRARREMFAIYGTICHLCGHDGAGEADHLVPISVDSDQPLDPHRMRPAQQLVLTHGLGEQADGSWASFKNSVWVPRQNGKGAVIEALETRSCGP